MASRRCTADLDTSVLRLATHPDHPAYPMAKAMLYRLPKDYLVLDLKSQNIPKQHARRIANLAEDIARPIT